MVVIHTGQHHHHHHLPLLRASRLSGVAGVTPRERCTTGTRSHVWYGERDEEGGILVLAQGHACLHVCPPSSSSWVRSGTASPGRYINTGRRAASPEEYSYAEFSGSSLPETFRIQRYVVQQWTLVCVSSRGAWFDGAVNCGCPAVAFHRMSSTSLSCRRDGSPWSCLFGRP